MFFSGSGSRPMRRLTEAQLRSIRNLKDFEAIIDSVVVSKVPHNGNEFDAFLVNDFNRGIKLECT